jgi:hypothetical protein
MKTHVTATFSLIGLLAFSAAPVLAQTPVSAIEISIGGIGPGVDATAFKKVKLLIADAVYRGNVDYFDVYGYGKEGGFSACVEAGRWPETGGFEKFVKALKAIKPNPATTAYSVTAVAQCNYPVTP